MSFHGQHMSLFLQQNIAAATQSVSETKVRQLGETTVRQFAKIQSIAPAKQNGPRCDTKNAPAEIHKIFILELKSNGVSFFKL